MESWNFGNLQLDQGSWTSLNILWGKLDWVNGLVATTVLKPERKTWGCTLSDISKSEKLREVSSGLSVGSLALDGEGNFSFPPPHHQWAFAWKSQVWRHALFLFTTSKHLKKISSPTALNFKHNASNTFIVENWKIQKNRKEKPPILQVNLSESGKYLEMNLTSREHVW